MRPHRNIHLDFIRGISVLFIIFLHYTFATSRIVSSNLILVPHYDTIGSLGVSMFFILSGASLALSTKDHFSLLQFYKKRFSAIFPLFWSTYILVVFTDSLLSQTARFVDRNPYSFILTILGFDGFFLYKGPNFYVIGEWFLGCIIILYALFPALRYLLHKNKYLLLFSSFVLCIIIEKFYNFDMEIVRFPLFRIFEFVFGMYFVTASSTLSKKSTLGLLVATLPVSISIFWFGLYNNIFISNAILGICCFVFLTTFSTLCENCLPKKIISFFSKYSFIAFLLHHVLIIKIVTLAKNNFLLNEYTPLFFIITVFCIYLVSFIFYSLLKKLFQTSLSIL